MRYLTHFVGRLAEWPKAVDCRWKGTRTMTINEFLRKYRRVEHGMNVTRPRVLCADGFTVSVQAGCGIYSIPRGDADDYTHVELGYPSQGEEALLKYAANGLRIRYTPMCPWNWWTRYSRRTAGLLVPTL